MGQKVVSTSIKKTLIIVETKSYLKFWMPLKLLIIGSTSSAHKNALHVQLFIILVFATQVLLSAFVAYFDKLLSYPLTCWKMMFIIWDQLCLQQAICFMSHATPM